MLSAGEVPPSEKTPAKCLLEKLQEIHVLSAGEVPPSANTRGRVHSHAGIRTAGSCLPWCIATPCNSG